MKKLLIYILLSVSSCAAQSVACNGTIAPSGATGADIGTAISVFADCVNLPDAPSQQIVKKPRVVDKKFVLIHTMYYTSMVLDGGSTTSGWAKGCEETNPIIHRFQTRPAIGLYLGGEAAIVTAFDYWLKRRIQQKQDGWAWMIVPTLMTADHAIAITHNQGIGCGF